MHPFIVNFGKRIYKYVTSSTGASHYGLLFILILLLLIRVFMGLFTEPVFRDVLTNKYVTVLSMVDFTSKFQFAIWLLLAFTLTIFRLHRFTFIPMVFLYSLLNSENPTYNFNRGVFNVFTDTQSGNPAITLFSFVILPIIGIFILSLLAWMPYLINLFKILVGRTNSRNSVTEPLLESEETKYQ